MKQEDIYQNLKELAEKLNISVSEYNFKLATFPVKSGLCTIKGKLHFVMDKHLSIHKKTKLLGAMLKQYPLETIYITPLVREFLEKCSDKDIEID